MIAIALALTMAVPSATHANLSQRQLDAISTKCATPKTWLKRMGDEIILGGSATGKFEKVECILGQLKRQHATNVGFLGNEEYDLPKAR